MKYFEKLIHYSLIAGGSILFLLSVMTTTDVFWRWLVNRPITGIYEVSELMFLALFFLPLAGVQYSGRQIKMDILSRHITGLPGKLLGVFLDALTFLFFSAILFQTSRSLITAYLKNEVTYGMIQIPTIIFYCFLWYGLFLTCLSIPIVIARKLASRSDEKGQALKTDY